MQSVVLYGRLLARVFVAGVNTEIPWKTDPARVTHNHLRELHLVTASSGISKSPHSSTESIKKWAFGDDACFVVKSKFADVIGVADGVGGWRSYGVDPSVFSTSLMETCERLVVEGKVKPHIPKEILKLSYEEILENKEGHIGSCTACIVSLSRQEKKVYTANLGDSGYLVIRKGKVIQRSNEQQHYFNTPFQLSVAPTSLQGQVIGDSPDSADGHSFGVEEDDMIIVGTDGLFDNMDDDMILQHVKTLKDPCQENLQSVANAIVKHCCELAHDPEYMSPFARNAVASGFGPGITGGKPDDITVLMAHVTAVVPDT